MESGAKGCEVVVSGKLRAARAKSMKFTVSKFFANQPALEPRGSSSHCVTYIWLVVFSICFVPRN